MDIQLTAHDVELTEAERGRIVSTFEKLARYHPRLNACRVVVDLDNTRRRHGRVYRVRVSLPVPQGEVAVSRQSSTNLRIAAREAFAAARRCLQDHVRLLRGDIKRHEEQIRTP